MMAKKSSSKSTKRNTVPVVVKRSRPGARDHTVTTHQRRTPAASEAMNLPPSKVAVSEFTANTATPDTSARLTGLRSRAALLRAHEIEMSDHIRAAATILIDELPEMPYHLPDQLGDDYDTFVLDLRDTLPDAAGAELLTVVEEMGLARMPRLGSANGRALNALASAGNYAHGQEAHAYQAAVFSAVAEVADVRREDATVRMREAFEDEDYFTALIEAKHVDQKALWSNFLLRRAALAALTPDASTYLGWQPGPAVPDNKVAKVEVEAAAVIASKSALRVRAAIDTQMEGAETPERWHELEALNEKAKYELGWLELLEAQRPERSRAVLERAERRDLARAALFKRKFGYDLDPALTRT